MFIKQADLFWGLGHDCVKEITDRGRKVSHRINPHAKEGFDTLKPSC